MRKDSCISSSGGGFGREGICFFLFFGACVVVKGVDIGVVGILILGGVVVTVDIESIGWRRAAVARRMPLLQWPKARGSSILFVWCIRG